MPQHDDQESQTFTLSDGRRITFAQFGDLEGTPILCNHGTPSCRLEYRYWEPAAKKLNARLIAPDRPGLGLSTHYRDRKLLDWPKDVEELMQHLKLDRYHVLGGSGGGPFALACAKELPSSQIISANVWAAAGPPEMGLQGMNLLGRLALLTWKYWPGLMKWFDRHFVIPPAQDPDPRVTEQFILKTSKYMSQEERDLCKDPFYMNAVRDCYRETYRQGGEGSWEEMRILGEHWGFSLEAIEVEGIKLFYGTDDKNTPLVMGKYMQERLKGANLIEFQGKTHFTIDTSDNGEAILRTILNQG